MIRAGARAASCLALWAGLAAADIPIDNLRGEGYADMGQLVKGDNAGLTVRDTYLSRLGANLVVSDTVGGRLSLRIAVGGLFWQSFPEGDFWQNFIKFGPGITEASSKLELGAGFAVEGGYFPLKYDHPAMNLGEYLLRTESYPTYLVTGGWQWVDSAYARVLGARLSGSHFGGAFRHELGVYFEAQNAPLWDVSPAYVFAWTPVKGVEIGGGAVLRRWFTNNRAYFGSASDAKSALTATRYVTVANFPEVQNQARVHYAYVDGSGARVEADTFAVWRPGSALDQTALLAGKNGAQVVRIEQVQDGSAPGSRSGIQRFLMNARWSDGTDCYAAQATGCVAYYDTAGQVAATDADGKPTGTGAAAQITHLEEITRSAVNLMARLDLDLADLLDVKASTGPFRLYSEIALLGAANQPVYFEDRSQRMPVMFGMHVPTFGLLDLLAVETEFLPNPYPDSQQELSIHNREALVGPSMAIPDLPADAWKLPLFRAPGVRSDDWKWSIHAVRTLVPGLKAKLQVANDHMRLQNLDIGGILPSVAPQTVKRDQWYYLAHLEWAL